MKVKNLPKQGKAISRKNMENLTLNQKTLEKPERQSGIELLRIFAMLIIVFHHAFMYGVYDRSNPAYHYIFDILQLGGKLGVNIFVIISAYFMVGKKFKLTRILTLWLTTLFYALIFFIINLFIGDVTLTGVFKSFFPVFSDHYWFITTYVLLMFVSPALNIVIKTIPQKKFKIGLLVLVPMLILYRLVARMFWLERDFPALTPFIWFIVLYFIAAYIKLYGIKIKKQILLLALIIVTIFQIVFTKFDRVEIGYCWTIGNTLLAILYFLIFKDFNFRSKFVNTTASTMVGVYLIHGNFYAFRWCWRDFVGVFEGFISNPVLAVSLCAICVFIICILIDLVRVKTIHKLNIKLMQKIDKKLEEKSQKKIAEDNKEAENQL